jgi:hypothetical protein
MRRRDEIDYVEFPDYRVYVAGGAPRRIRNEPHRAIPHLRSVALVSFFTGRADVHLTRSKDSHAIFFRSAQFDDGI